MENSAVINKNLKISLLNTKKVVYYIQKKYWSARDNKACVAVIVLFYLRLEVNIYNYSSINLKMRRMRVGENPENTRVKERSREN